MFLFVSVYSNECPWILITYRTDGHLLRKRQMQASTRLSTTTVYDLFLAADCSDYVLAVVDMKRGMDLFVSVCVNFELAIKVGRAMACPRTSIAASPTAPAPPPSASTTTTALTANAQNPRVPLPSATAIPIITATASAEMRATTTAHAPATGKNSSDSPSATTFSITTPTSRDVNSILACSHCDRTFSPRIGLAGHLRNYRIATGALVPAAPIYTRRLHLHC
ncbi:hypothetical protein SprV_0501974800 [Sparganum proliferum]